MAAPFHGHEGGESPPDSSLPLPPSPAVDLHYLDNHHLDGVHRSGWAAVITALEAWHWPGALILDGYLDRTFGWEADSLTARGLLPFRRSWVGFFHHTGSEAACRYSTNNLQTCLQHSSFRASLGHCRALFVLSHHSALWLSYALTDRFSSRSAHIRVIPLLHPTHTVVPMFSWSRFQSQPQRPLVQIGAWLRNSYAIFDLPGISGYQKMALKGPRMDEYFPTSSHLPQLARCLSTLEQAQSLAPGAIITSSSSSTSSSLSTTQPAPLVCRGSCPIPSVCRVAYPVLRREQVCCACLEVPPNVIYAHCGHCVLCDNCDLQKANSACPMCRCDSFLKVLIGTESAVVMPTDDADSWTTNSNKYLVGLYESVSRRQGRYRFWRALVTKITMSY